MVMHRRCKGSETSAAVWSGVAAEQYKAGCEGVFKYSTYSHMLRKKKIYDSC